jgi:hypothetical protein
MRTSLDPQTVIVCNLSARTVDVLLRVGCSAARIVNTLWMVAGLLAIATQPIKAERIGDRTADTCQHPARDAFMGCYYSRATPGGWADYVRRDTVINFDWESGPPDSSVSDTFSVRWQGMFSFASGVHVFRATFSEGIRVYIDGAIILDGWNPRPARTNYARTFVSHGVHLVTVECDEQSRGGSVALRWTESKPAENTPSDTQLLTAPEQLAATVGLSTGIDLSWSAARQSVAGVSGYELLRDGSVLASVPGNVLAYTDRTAAASSTYSYSVRAYNAAGNYSGASNTAYVAAPLATAASRISSCGDIRSSGNYVLTADLKASSYSSCLNIHDVTNVQVDCQQHSITVDRQSDSGAHAAIAITNVSHYAISNCKLIALNTSQAASMATLHIVNSPLGTITNNSFADGYVSISGSDNLEVSHNVSNRPVEVSGNNETIEYNTLTLDSGELHAAVLLLGDSSGSTVQFNVLNGGWDGMYRQTWQSQIGADDGLLLQNVSNSIVQNNTILNNWGCGIENVRPMVNVQVAANQIGTAGYCGIGGWYGESLSGVTVAGNTVTDTPRLLQYMRADALYTALDEQKVYFLNNTFSGNRLVRPRVNVFAAGCSRVDFQNLPPSIPAGAVVIGNNRFSNNDFGPFGNLLWLFPGTSMLDGGGNTCLPDSSNPSFPLHCTAPGVISGGYYAINAYPVSVPAGGSISVIYGANPAGVGDYIGLAQVGASDTHFVSTQSIGGIGWGSLLFTAPSTPGQYELRYMKAGASSHSQISNSVTVGGGAITSFTAAPAIISAGQSATLSWSVSGSGAISIDSSVGDVTGRSSVTVSPVQTTTYRLSANTGGTVLTATATVTVNPPVDTQPPTTPALRSAVVINGGAVQLTWSASTDNVGVSGYQLIRSGSPLTIVGTGVLSYIDIGVAPNNTYSYSVKAVDAAGNYSSASNLLYATIPYQATVPCPGPAIDAFTGCYYNNTSLSGNASVVRQDSQVNLPFWPYTVPGAVSANSFSVRWQGNFNFDAGTYIFLAYTSDGMRTYIDGKAVLDVWRDQDLTGYNIGRVTLTQGRHLIKVEYYSSHESPRASVFWMKN